MQKNKILKNYCYSLSYQILLIILPIITLPYVSRVLKPEGLGIFSYSYAVVSYITIVLNSGFSLYGNRQISAARDNYVNLKKVFLEIYLVKTMMTLLVVALYICWVLNVDSNQRLLYLLQGLGLLAAFFDVTWFFNGLEQFRKTVSVNIIVKIISFLCILVFVRNTEDIYVYVVIVQGTSLVASMLLIPYLKEYKIFQGFNIYYLKKCKYLKHLAPILLLTISVASTAIYTVFNKVMVGIFTNTTQVGFFDNALKIITLIITVLTTIGTIMLPRATYQFAHGKLEDMKEHFNASFEISIIASIGMSAGLIAINRNFIDLFFGKGYESISNILPLMSLSIIPISLASVATTQFLIPRNKNMIYTLSTLFGAFVNVFMNFILIPRYGILGATFSYLITETVVTCIQVLVCHSIIRFKENVVNSITSILSAILMLLLLEIEKYWLNYIINDFFLFLIQMISGIITYIMCLFTIRNKIIRDLLLNIYSAIQRRSF